MTKFLRLLPCLWLVKASLSFVPQSHVSSPRQEHGRTNALFATMFNSDDSKRRTYVRWNKQADTWKMQTAVTTFKRGNETVELHAQLHFGDKSYFDFYNSQEFDKHQSVHYELLIDNDLLKYDNGNWRLKTNIMASPNDQSLAQQYGWACQVDSIDYTNSKWVHSDLSRQEFLRLAGEDATQGDQGVPLWKLASSPQSTSAAAEAISALLVGPPTLSYSTRFVKRRLFTNLFLPGSTLANNIRAMLWLTVPAPELSIMLLDWASLLQGGSNPNGLSPIAIPTLKSMLNLDIQQTRKFLLGQVLTSSTEAARQSEADQTESWSLLVTKRNDHAIKILDKTIRDYRASSSNPYSTALLYGSSHCPDLHAKLTSMGFVPTNTVWRTAWSIQEQRSFDEKSYLAALGAFLVVYLGVGALDWISMMGDVSQAWVESAYLDAGVAAGLYLVRHVLLYLGLSKVLVDWNRSGNNNF